MGAFLVSRLKVGTSKTPFSHPSPDLSSKNAKIIKVYSHLNKFSLQLMSTNLLAVIMVLQAD